MRQYLLADYAFFLFIETKKPGEAFFNGQQRALVALSQKPGIDVLLVKGTPGDPLEHRWLINGIWREWKTSGRRTIQSQVDAWYKKNDRERRVIGNGRGVK